MSMIAHLQHLFAYDDWANNEVLASLQALESPPIRPQRLLAHILSAERLWLERLLSEPQTYPVWPEFSLLQCTAEADVLQQRWRTYLEAIGEGGLSHLIAYKNTKGERFESQRQDVLMHVVMHSSYHRGQIAADMRAAGVPPPYTDFIHAVRQGFVE